MATVTSQDRWRRVGSRERHAEGDQVAVVGGMGVRPAGRERADGGVVVGPPGGGGGGGRGAGGARVAGFLSASTEAVKWVIPRAGAGSRSRSASRFETPRR